MNHTVLPANYIMRAFTRQHSPGGATTIASKVAHVSQL